MGSNTLTQLSDQTNRVMFTCVCAAETWFHARLRAHARSPLTCRPTRTPHVFSFLLYGAVRVLPLARICLFQSPASLCGEKLSGFFFLGAFWQRDHAHSQLSDPLSALASAQL